MSRLSSSLPRTLARCFSAARPDINFEYLLDPAHVDVIRTNIQSRKGVGDIDRLHEQWRTLRRYVESGEKGELTAEQFQTLWDEFYDSALSIPNMSHTSVPQGDEDCNEVLEEWGPDVVNASSAKMAEKVAQPWRSLLSPAEACGQRAYSFVGALARLERALCDFAFDEVVAAGYTPVTVSDLVPASVTRACGVQQKTEGHAMQYFLADDRHVALSGTAEMGVAALLRDRTFKPSELPIRLVAESRCFRPEISKSAVEARLYRVHEFTKVEMFAVCEPGKGLDELDRIVAVQKALFGKLGLRARLLNMASEELGAPAHKKYDVEAWMRGRRLWGEVSSASNCTDYQARRLNMHVLLRDGSSPPAETCNGTALAATRAIIAVLETHQTEKGGLDLPACLQPYLSKFAPPIRFSKASPLCML